MTNLWVITSKKNEVPLMKIVIILLLLILIVASGSWFYIHPGFDSGIALVTALITSIGLLVKERNKEKSLNQVIKNNSFGIQAGGNVNINGK